MRQEEDKEVQACAEPGEERDGQPDGPVAGSLVWDDAGAETTDAVSSELEADVNRASPSRLAPPQASASEIAALVAKAKADASAFGLIYEVFWEQIVCYCAVRVGLSDAEDVAQQVFLKVLRRMSTVDASKSFCGLLYSVAHGTTIDWLRRRGRMHARHHAAAEEWRATATSEEETAETARNEESAVESLAQLPEPELTIVTMRINQGMGFQAIAAALQKSIGYVHEHWTHARYLMKRNMLSAEGGEEGNE